MSPRGLPARDSVPAAAVSGEPTTAVAPQTPVADKLRNRGEVIDAAVHATCTSPLLVTSRPQWFGSTRCRVTTAGSVHAPDTNRDAMIPPYDPPSRASHSSVGAPLGLATT